MKKPFKHLFCIFLALISILTLTFSANAEAGASSLMGRFSKEPYYGGAYYSGGVFYIASTDVEAFEKLRTKLSANENYAGKALVRGMFSIKTGNI